MTGDDAGPESTVGLGPSSERFSILVCVDGSQGAYRALKYAVRIGSGTDADLTLLYVRPVDQGLRTGGLPNLRGARKYARLGPRAAGQKDPAARP